MHNSTVTTPERWMDEQAIALLDEVEIMVGIENETLLYNETNGHYTRVSSAGERVLPLLDGSRTASEIADRASARASDPGRARELLLDFIGELRNAGVLTIPSPKKTASRDRARSGAMLRLKLVRDAHEKLQPMLPVTRRIAAVAKRWLTLSTLAICVALIVAGQLTGPLVPDGGVRWLIAVPVVIGLILLHESSHAIVLTHYEVPIRSAGIGLMLFLVPVAYVDRTDAYRLEERFSRAMVSLIGPIMDLLMLGLMSGLVLVLDGDAESTVRMIIALQLAALAFNLNPLLPTDGYQAIEAATGGVNVRKRSFALLKNIVLRRPVPSGLREVRMRSLVGYVVFSIGISVYLAAVVTMMVLGAVAS